MNGLDLPGGIGKKALMDRLASSEAARRFASIRAEEERALIENLIVLAESIGAEIDPELRAFDPEDRIDRLLALAEALPDDEAAAEWYANHRLPDPDLAAYVGMDDPDAQIEAWADRYREDVDGEHTDRELAEAHVRRAFDVPSLEWWEQHVAAVETDDIVRDAVARWTEKVAVEMNRLSRAE
ncbi:MAG: hypothetical protein ABEH78_07965 [Haloferacaceae archaeon]